MHHKNFQTIRLLRILNWSFHNSLTGSNTEKGLCQRDLRVWPLFNGLCFYLIHEKFTGIILAQTESDQGSMYVHWSPINYRQETG